MGNGVVAEIVAPEAVAVKELEVDDTVVRIKLALDELWVVAWDVQGHIVLVAVIVDVMITCALQMLMTIHSK